MSDEQDRAKRDLELMLLGASLVRGETRDRVLASFPNKTMAGDVGEMLDAIRNQDARFIEQWFKDHGCDWGKGQDMLQTVIDWGQDEKVRSWAVSNLKGLMFLFQTSPMAEARAKAIAMLKKFSD